MVSGKNVIIRKNVFRSISRKDMPGGIDIEPNNSAYTISGIRIFNNLFEGISTNAIQLYIPKDVSAHDVIIKGNTIKSSGNGLSICVFSNNITDFIQIIGNYIDEKTRPYFFNGNGKSSNWVVSNNIFDRPCQQVVPGNIIVNNLVVKKNKKKD